MHHRAVRCHTDRMPTTRRRHQVTETDELAAALDAAQARWPEVSRGRLLVVLALEGFRTALAEPQDRRAARRREAVLRHAGALSGAYPEGYLAALREDWPQ